MKHRFRGYYLPVDSYITGFGLHHMGWMSQLSEGKDAGQISLNYAFDLKGVISHSHISLGDLAMGFVDASALAEENPVRPLGHFLKVASDDHVVALA